MASYPIRLDGLLAKIETDYGVDPTPTTTANGIRLSQRVWSSLRIGHAYPNRRTEAASGTLIRMAPPPMTGRIADLEITVELSGFGAAYSATDLPSAHPLIRSCGLGQAVVTTGGSETVTYTRADSAHESCTIWAYAGANLYKITGCRGNLRWTVTAGGLLLGQFTMRGLMAVAPAATALPAITYTAQVPPPAIACAIAIGGVSTMTIASCEFATGATIVQVPGTNATYGIAGFEISRFDPTFRANVKTIALGTYDPYAAAQAATATTISVTHGSTQYKRLKLTVTSAGYLMDPEHEDQDGFTGWLLPFDIGAFSLLYD
jgi:hypothetical protein